MREERKDILIAQLNAENSDAKKRERDYMVLKSQSVDLQRRFRNLQEQKLNFENAIMDKEKRMSEQNAQLKQNAKLSQRNAEEYTKKLANLQAEAAAYKEVSEDKNIEISQLKNELMKAKIIHDNLARSKNVIQSETKEETDKCKIAEEEIDQLIAQNDMISRKQAKVAAKEKDNALLILRLNREIDDLSSKLDHAVSTHKEKDEELNHLIHGKSKCGGDIKNITEAIAQQDKSGKQCVLDIKDLELRINRAKQQLADHSALSEVKDREIASAGSDLSFVEQKNAAAFDEIKRIQSRNETLRIEVEQWRNEANEERRKRDRETVLQLEMEQDKRKLVRDLEARAIELKIAKKREQENEIREKALNVCCI